MNDRAVMVITSILTPNEKLSFCAKCGTFYVGVGKCSKDDLGAYYLYDPDSDEAYPIPTMMASSFMSDISESDVVLRIDVD